MSFFRKAILHDYRHKDVDALAQKRDIVGLIGVLKHSKDFMLCGHTRDVLIALADEQTVDLLSAALKQASDHAREQLVRTLAGIASARCVPPLIGALADQSKDVRREAARGLGKLQGSPVVEALFGALGDPVASVREVAVFALSNQADERITEGLIGALQDQAADVRLAAVKVLAEMQDERVILPLANAVRDPDERVRKQAAFGLMNLGEQIKFKDGAIVPPLLAGLKDSNSDIRKYARYALTKVEAGLVAAPLIEALPGQNTDFREAVIFILGDLDDISPQVLDVLIAALHDPHGGSYQTAALALGRHGHIVPLLDALKAEEPNVRANAAWGLGAADGSPRLIEPLIDALADPDPDAHFAAAYTLGAGFVGERAVAALVSLLGDNEGTLRRRSLERLEELGWQATAYEDQVNVWVIKEMWPECATIRPEAVDPLIRFGLPRIEWEIDKIEVNHLEAMLDAIQEALQTQPDRLSTESLQNLLKAKLTKTVLEEEMFYRVVYEDEYGKQYESEPTGKFISKERDLRRQEITALAAQELARRGIA